MKIRLLSLIGAFAVVAFFFYQYFPAMGATPASMEVQSTPTSTNVQESSDQTQLAIELSGDLTAKWIESLGDGEWLYISTKYETDQELGVDPETGWPIPNLSHWEVWYQLDDQGRQTVAITKRTDLLLGNVTYGIWKDGELMRLPSGVREKVDEELGFETFRPIWDHYCNTRLSNLVNSPEEGIISTVTLTRSADGNEWETSIAVTHPVVEDVSGFSDSFVGYELNCYRNSETGAIIKAEEYLITKDGGKAVLGLDYDYMVQWVPDLPDEIMAVLAQLESE